MNSEVKKLSFDSRDEFKRKETAEQIKSLLYSEVDISPTIIDGSWGTGKTEFCFKLIELMQKDDTHHLLYVDAYQADHADEPLLTVLAEVLKLVPEEEGKRHSLIQKLLPAIRFGLKTTLKAGVGHLLRQDASDIVEDFDKEIKQVTDKAIDASVEAILIDHIKASESLRALQKALEELAKEKPIIIFIDELDRCRPDFAVNMLEIIKHTFDVSCVQFVLITNTEQLKASINNCYGRRVDAKRYLDKFIKYSFMLSDQYWGTPHKKESTSVAHYRNLIQDSELLKTAKLDEAGAFDFVAHFIKLHSLSLREIESFVRQLEIYQILTKNKGFEERLIYGYKLFRLLGILLFTFNPELTNAMVNDCADAVELGIFTGCKGIPEYDGGYPSPEHQDIVTVILGGHLKFNSSKFTPSDVDSKKKWQSLADKLFSNSMYGDSNEDKIIIGVIDVLRLNQSR